MKSCAWRMQGLDVKAQRVVFTDESGKEVKADYDLLVGADGVNSRVRCCSAFPNSSLQLMDPTH